MFHNSNDKPWKSSRILRVKLAVTCFGQIYFVHDLLLPRPNLATNQRRRNHKKSGKQTLRPTVCGCWFQCVGAGCGFSHNQHPQKGRENERKKKKKKKKKQKQIREKKASKKTLPEIVRFGPFFRDKF